MELGKNLYYYTLVGILLSYKHNTEGIILNSTPLEGTEIIITKTYLEQLGFPETKYTKIFKQAQEEGILSLREVESGIYLITLSPEINLIKVLIPENKEVIPPTKAKTRRRRRTRAEMEEVRRKQEEQKKEVPTIPPPPEDKEEPVTEPPKEIPPDSPPDLPKKEERAVPKPTPKEEKTVAIQAPKEQVKSTEKTNKKSKTPKKANPEQIQIWKVQRDIYSLYTKDHVLGNKGIVYNFNRVIKQLCTLYPPQQVLQLFEIYLGLAEPEYEKKYHQISLFQRDYQQLTFFLRSDIDKSIQILGDTLVNIYPNLLINIKAKELYYNMWIIKEKFKVADNIILDIYDWLPKSWWNDKIWSIHFFRENFGKIYSQFELETKKKSKWTNKVNSQLTKVRENYTANPVTVEFIKNKAEQGIATCKKNLENPRVQANPREKNLNLNALKKHTDSLAQIENFIKEGNSYDTVV